ncbi:chloride channel protein [Rhodovibrio salinarum]|nr:chloride channel protein [Rhodovibrio salinarum]
MTPVGAWGPWIILAPVIGGMGVVFLVNTFAPEARGHGVPEVMDAIYYKEGKIRPVVAVVKSLASALSIGSGAAVGREGPIIQIGSSFGSSFAQAIGLAAWQRVTLIACGAGAGIAATFNTPLGGVMFAIELMMPEVSSRTFLPVVLATGTATYVGRLFFGIEPAFVVSLASMPDVEPLNWMRLGGFVMLGLACGLGSFVFVRLLAVLEEQFPRLPVNPYIQHALGMGLVGVMMYTFSQVYGHYFVEGVGYATIQGILDGHFTTIGLLMLLFVGKLLATTISLGSGASGGIFSPSLFLGSTLGGLMGAGLTQLFPEAGFTIPEFAMVGMSGVVGGATGAAMTAIVMIFEMTRDYNIIVPMIVATALAIGVRRVLSPENIYTIKLAARGRYIPKERHTNMFLVRHAHEVMETHLAFLPADMDAKTASDTLDEMDPYPAFVILHEGDHIAGVLPSHAVYDVAQHGSASAYVDHSQGHHHGYGRTKDSRGHDLPAEAFVLARPDDILHDVMRRLGRGAARLALVIDTEGVPRTHDVRGVISLDDVGHEVLRHFQG